MDRLVASPCSLPQWELDKLLPAYAKLGFTQFEAFSGWVKSALDFNHDPQEYRALAEKHGVRFTSFHLPVIDKNLGASLDQAIDAAKFAQALGTEVVLFKGCDRPTYIRAAKPFLDAIEDVNVTPVLQNHAHSPIATVADYREVIEGINDPRMKTLLEVGHFHAAGEHWRDGHALLGRSVALVHIKDMAGRKPVPFGTGEIDFCDLFSCLQADGYTGKFVIEMEVNCNDTAQTLQWLGDTRALIEKLFQEIGHE